MRRNLKSHFVPSLKKTRKVSKLLSVTKCDMFILFVKYWTCTSRLLPIRFIAVFSDFHFFHRCNFQIPECTVAELQLLNIENLPITLSQLFIIIIC